MSDDRSRGFYSRALAACLCAWVVLGALESLAAAPPYLPVQGVLTDTEGEPIDGSIEIRFALYDTDTGGQALWSETQTVLVEGGLFSVYLGMQSQLDLSLFKAHELIWLGIQVAGGEEMARVFLGTIPFSGYAEHASYQAGEGIQLSIGNVITSTLGSSVDGNEIEDGTIRRADLAADGCTTDQILRFDGTGWICSDPPGTGSSIPAGAVMLFNRTSCPAGWSELGAGRGRVVVGLPAGGTLGGTRGAALGDLGSRTITDVPAHAHDVDAISASTSQAGSHSHSISGSSASTSTAGAHTHPVSDPGHDHSAPLVYGWDYTSSGFASSSSSGISASTSSSTTGISIQSDGAHSHTLDLGSLSTDAQGEHSHALQIGAFSTRQAGAAAVDVSMPYIQLLMCQKD
ncbi:MAG: hypothetical protein JXR96_06730 [Deltaproteobacteria bacterium]|nr:hypothetical protein [Deltaproteobacteria bacterium]